MGLTEIRKKLRDLKKVVAEDQRDATQRVRFWMVLVGALLAAACQFIELRHDLMPWVRAGGIFGALIAFFGGYWTYRADRHAAGALQLADEATESAQTAETAAADLRRRLQVDFHGLRSQHLQLRRLLTLANILREGVERAITQLPTMDLKTNINNLMLGSYRATLAALGCEAGERWTLTIYREAAGILEDMAAATVDRGAQTIPVRKWPVGQGFAGAAFARDLEIVLAEAQQPAVLSMLNVPAHMLKPDDASKYRSVAAVPIRVAGLAKPWGVVIATSDKSGRFDPGDNSEGALSAQAVRLMAGMLALLVAAEPSKSNTPPAKAATSRSSKPQRKAAPRRRKTG